MEWYLSVLKQYAEFSGRARRKEYWMFTLINCLIIMALMIVTTVISPSGKGSVLVSIYQLALFIPSLAVGVRRMHDTDHSGWWIICPIVNLVFACMEGTQGDNRFGYDPKLVAEPA